MREINTLYEHFSALASIVGCEWVGKHKPEMVIVMLGKSED
jgi:hypothetical protein